MQHSFTDIFIKRPVLASVISLLIVLVGARAYFDLPLRLYPKVASTSINVSVNYTGADASLMESFVSSPIETAIAGVEGIDYITSKSSQGSSSISAHFKLGFPLDQAITDVANKVASVRGLLPKDVDDPIISKNDPNATPIVYIGCLSKHMSTGEVTDYIQRVVQPILQAIPGVSSAEILGGSEFAMDVWLDPYRMAAHNITPADVQQALHSNNLQSPAGRIQGASQEFNVKPLTGINTASAFNNLIIANKDQQLIRISDVGKAELGEKYTRFSFFMSNKKAVVIAINTKSDANPLTVATDIKTQMPELTKNLPQDLHIKIMWDSSKFINESIYEVKKTIVEAAIFVILVVFLFLGSLRILTIPTIAIPLSLIGVCAIMLAMGYSLNSLTFLAMVLAIGMVVDDAIVVAENIHRHIEAGKDSLEAAIIGTREIKFAVIVMTLTLAAVYAPIGFMGGLTGSLFKEFAFALAGAVIISGFIALTLTPMMCSKVMTADTLQGRLSNLANNFSNKLAHGYSIVLEKVLKLRLVVLVALLVVLAACYFLYRAIPSELVPEEDSGFLMVFAQAPSAANLSYTEKYTKQVAKIIGSLPEVESFGIVNGAEDVNSAIAFMSFKPWHERSRSTEQIRAELFPKLWAIPGIQAIPINPSMLPGAGYGMPLRVILKTTGTYTELNQTMQKLITAIQQNPRILNPDSDLKIDKPQLDIKIDRNKAGVLGISSQEIGQALYFALGRMISGHFTIRGRDYDVLTQLAKPFRDQPNALNNIHLRTSSGKLTPLANVAQITETVQPVSLNHFQQMRAATLQASIVPGYTLGQAIDFITQQAKQVLPHNIQLDFAGNSRQFIQSSGEMLVTFVFALLFIFLILAAQFESFRDPLIVMFSVPLSTVGALTALKLIGGTMNIYTEIGLVTLVGLISKHGILMVEFANQLQDQNIPLRSAIMQAATIRLRPILMTTAAMILGALPLALASGAGAVCRSQLGWTIVGGMTIGTVFTLFVVPVVYSYFAHSRNAGDQ